MNMGGRAYPIRHYPIAMRLRDRSGHSASPLTNKLHRKVNFSLIYLQMSNFCCNFAAYLHLNIYIL